MQRLIREVERVPHIQEQYRESLLGRMGETLQQLRSAPKEQRREIFLNGENGNWIINVSKVKTRSENISRYKQSWRVGGPRTGSGAQSRVAAMIEASDSDAADFIRGLEPSDDIFETAEALDDAQGSLYTLEEWEKAYRSWADSDKTNPTESEDTPPQTQHIE